MKNFILISLALSLSLQSALATLPRWSYDSGPNPDTKMGRELIDLTAAIPDMPLVSMKVMGDQKFRPAYGPVPWRMLQDPGKTKILFIGQDATHIAEAAGRPATAGFGGRAQDLAAYFGVNEGAAFINTYAYTIKGQYGAHGTPYILRAQNGDQVKVSNLVDNKLWLLTQDQASPITKWRNNLIDWIVRNNKNSIKLIVTFGGAARDAMGSFIISKGGNVGAFNASQMSKIQIPETRLAYAGGNNEFPILVDQDGKDLYSKIMGRKLDYSKPEDQAAAQKSLKENLEVYKREMIFTKQGPMKNGILNAAQLGGYDLGKIEINGMNVRSLKGLKLNDGTIIEEDVLVVELPHPTALSNMSTPAEASRAVAEKLKVLNSYVNAGWVIEADPGQVNSFALKLPYAYRRADIGPEYYDFGTPGTRMVPVSTASRMSGNAHVIVFGTREKARFDNNKVQEMTDAQPAISFSPFEIFTNRPRTKDLRYTFDPGPGKTYARLMKENLDLENVFKTKPGLEFSKNGIDTYYVKNHPDIGDYGHYRGTFKDPKVLILADPHGHDDLITARALTGTRGQYLQGLIEDMGLTDQYLVIKTVPFSMDGASSDDWKYVLEVTDSYRKKLVEKVLKDNQVELIITDGVNAQSEIIKLINDKNIPVVMMNRTEDNKADIKDVANKISLVHKRVSASSEMRNIPRSHLSFYARIWEGTSGDRVLASQDKYKGLAFAEVAPAWAWKQTDAQSIENTTDDVKDLIRKLDENNLPRPGENIPKYLKRTQIDPFLTFVHDLLGQFFKAA